MPELLLQLHAYPDEETANAKAKHERSLRIMTPPAQRVTLCTQPDVDSTSPVVVEDFIWQNAGMLTEMKAVVISKLVDGALLLPHLPPLLPYPVLIVQVLQKPERPF